MTEDALVKINQFGANTALAINTFYNLASQEWASEHTETVIGGLVNKLKECLSSIANTETVVNLPTLRNVRTDLTVCLSGIGSLSKDKIIQLVSRLERYTEPLNQVATQHTDTLSNVKRLELESKKAESSLLNKASQLEQTAKRKKNQGYWTSFAGGMLAIPTLGTSYFALGKKGDSLAQAGEDMMHEHRTIKAEMDIVFPIFSSLVQRTVQTGELLSAMITSLSADVRNLSESRNPRQLRKVQAKAVIVDRAIARYISVTQFFFANTHFFPYNRNSRVTCEGCEQEIGPAEMFYHCIECPESVDFCAKCYLPKRHESHSWTKHSKAQYLIQGYQICNECRDVIHWGLTKMCGTCEFELCPRCTHKANHKHPLQTAEVRWYGDFVPRDTKCDECWCPATECDVMFQCLECYWYFVCINCKIGLKHPHELVKFDIVQEEAEHVGADTEGHNIVQSND